MVLIMGEISTTADIDIPAIARKAICDIGYDSADKGFDGNTCAIITSLDKQSPDIAMGVDASYELKGGEEDKYNLNGAGDQGMMFGYACNETDNYMPLSLDLSHLLLTELAVIRREASAMTYLRKGKVTSYLRPDSKSQVTSEYNERNEPVRVHTIVLSTQHDEFGRAGSVKMQAFLVCQSAPWQIHDCLSGRTH